MLEDIGCISFVKKFIVPTEAYTFRCLKIRDSRLQYQKALDGGAWTAPLNMCSVGVKFERKYSVSITPLLHQSIIRIYSVPFTVKTKQLTQFIRLYVLKSMKAGCCLQSVRQCSIYRLLAQRK